MKKPLWSEISYHLAKAQTMLADGAPPHDVQLEINIAKALVENHVDHDIQVEEQQITSCRDRITTMFEMLHQLKIHST